MTGFLPERIFIERGELDTPIARTVRERASGRCPIDVVEDGRTVVSEHFAQGKRQLVLQRHRGSFLQACPAGTSGLVCCSYIVLNLASNCPYDCSYCFLQAYLADNPTLKAFTNVNAALEEVGAVLRAHPQKEFRIGTGEVADSLALDGLTGLSRLLVPFFAEWPNATLELKTKSDCVADLLDLEPKGRVVVAWSMNAPTIAAEEEHGAASLERRLAAARRVIEAGYRVAFHFDPLVEFDGWEREYAAVVEQIFDAVDAARVAWVSLGGLRLGPALEGAIRRRARPSRVLAAELVPCGDGKARVWHGLRARMYRHLTERLRRVGGVFPVYLCMEGPGMWDSVMGEIPSDRALGMRLAAGSRW